MTRHNEIEIKLRVRDPRALKRQLKNVGFRTTRARHFERNVVFDFPDRRLRKSRCLLRLRFVDGKGLLTFKGTPVRAGRYKIRHEIEAGVEDAERLEGILQEVGLREIFRYEKFRTAFALRSGSNRHVKHLLLYDETPIGNYVELEGSKRWIDLIARRLGYVRADYIPESYGTLYQRHCVKHGKKPNNMVFGNHK
jgi:adenylate cyclase class 2